MLKQQFEFIKDRGEDNKNVLINYEKKLPSVDPVDKKFSFFFHFFLIFQNISWGFYQDFFQNLPRIFLQNLIIPQYPSFENFPS